MKISGINSTQSIGITPTELLERFKKGERPEYKINSNDKMMQELNTLAETYKQTLSVDKKANLINKELEILYEELKKPELTLSRNYKEIPDMIPKNFSPQEIDDTLRLFNITGIHRIEKLPGSVYEHTTSKENIEILKNVYSLFDETSKIGNRGRNFVIMTLGVIEERKPEFKPLIQNTYKELLDITKDKKLKEAITLKSDSIDTYSALKQLKENPNNEALFRSLILKNSSKNNDIKQFIVKILKDEKADSQMIRTAILGGGKFRNDEIFKMIKKFALDTKEPDIRKREFAIQSTALYVKDKPQEVKQVLEQVHQECSIFSPLSKILLDKTSGNYHGQKDRELNYTKITKKQADRFKNLFEHYFQIESTTNTKQKNLYQLSAVPFRKYLKRFINTGKKYIIQNDTYTKHAPDYIAKRYLFPEMGIFASGDYMDAWDAVNWSKYSIVTPFRAAEKAQNIIAHENGHSVQYVLTSKDDKIISKLFRNAVREGRILDYYAAANPFEYFAQGCEAFVSKYKPHKDILNNHPFAHTVYELMDKDPELFKFIKKVLKRAY